MESKYSLDALMGRESAAGRALTEVRYSEFAEYPDDLVVGDKLFPMLAIYYLGDKAGSAKIGYPEKFNEGLSEYFSTLRELRTANGSGNTEDASGIESRFRANCPKFKRMFVDATNKNSTFLWQLANVVSALVAPYKSRVPTRAGSYYKVGKGANKSFNYWPTLTPGQPGQLFNAMETLRLLFENDIIAWDQTLDVRPISIFDARFADEQTGTLEREKMLRLVGLPVQGIFTVNNSPKTSQMFRTFSGIDIKAIASLNTAVTPLKGMTSLSWSIHRGSSPVRPLGKVSGIGRPKGPRTIAGTMIFTLFDHHPLNEILPENYPVDNQLQLVADSRLQRPMILADQIPPFDLVLILQNEYGFASLVSLYGIQIVDENTVLGIDNLVTEVVFQYTAVGMDPIVQCSTDAAGNIDPYGLLQGGFSKMFKHRESIIAGAAYSDLEGAYEAQYDAVFSTARARMEDRLSMIYKNK